MSGADAQMIMKKLSDDLVTLKLSKMRWYIRLYNWLHLSYTEQILFKNNKKELMALKQ